MRNKIEFINFKLQPSNKWQHFTTSRVYYIKKKNTFPLQELIWAMILILSIRSLNSFWDNLPNIDGTTKYFTGKFLSLKS